MVCTDGKHTCQLVHFFLHALKIHSHLPKVKDLLVPVFRIHDNWYGKGSADPYLQLTDPDPALFVSDIQDANINIFFHFFFAY
jgi:hypothetical protein